MPNLFTINVTIYYKNKHIQLVPNGCYIFNKIKLFI